MKVEKQPNGKVKIFLACDLCGAEFQHGQHRYEGHKCKGYNFMVCSGCWEGNWGGWCLYEGRVLGWLKAHGISEPARNSKGLLPREF